LNFKKKNRILKFFENLEILWKLKFLKLLEKF
jgi:hypothetical protein